MAKQNTAGKVASPSLWGKPLTRPGTKPADKREDEKVTRMRTDEDDNMDEDEVDVDAELADADAYAEADSDDVVAEDDDSDAVAETEEEETVDNDDDSEVDDDGLTYAPEAGDETADEEEDENVVSAVDDDEVDEEPAEDEEVAAEHTESRTRNMSEKKKVSLSDHVRAEIDKRKNAGASLRGVDIVAALEKRGINVSPAQVSQLLKKAGLGGAPRGRKGKAPAAAAATPEKPRAAMKAKKREVEAPATKPRLGLKRHPEPVERAAAKAPAKISNGFKVPLAQLQAAESFVDACGGSFKDAERILTAAANLSQTFGR